MFNVNIFLEGLFLVRLLLVNVISLLVSFSSSKGISGCSIVGLGIEAILLLTAHSVVVEWSLSFDCVISFSIMIFSSDNFFDVSASVLFPYG